MNFSHGIVWPARITTALAVVLVVGCNRTVTTIPPRTDRTSDDAIQFVQEGDAQYIDAVDGDAAVQAALSTADANKLRDVLSVAVAGSSQAMLGERSVVDRAGAKIVRFIPRFALNPGARYVVSFDTTPLAGASKGRKRELTVAIPKPVAPAPEVVAVYPSADVLPENQLRFYIHFSNPMRRGDIYRHFHLIGPEGKDVNMPFLELDEELWDETGKRLSLLFNPGRVKNELKPREEAGPVLVAGKKYTLVIDDGLSDANGESLKQEFRKAFTAGPAEGRRLDAASWTVTPPARPAGALVVKFGRSLDHGQLTNVRVPFLYVQDVGGRRVAGRVAVSDHESIWTFVPTQAWVGGRFSLVALPELSDSCGNNLIKPFEVDVQSSPSEMGPEKAVRIPFELAP